MADYFTSLVIQVIFMQIRESKLYKILYGPWLYLLDFRKRPGVAILTVYSLETLAIIGFISQLPLIHDTLATEIMKSIIETDGVLIGFAGLMATVLFTRPPYREKNYKELLQGTLISAAGSAIILILSILCSIFTMAYIKPGFGFRGVGLFWPVLTLVLGVTQLFLFVGYVSGAIPLPEKDKETSETNRISERAKMLKKTLNQIQNNEEKSN